MFLFIFFDIYKLSIEKDYISYLIETDLNLCIINWYLYLFQQFCSVQIHKPVVKLVIVAEGSKLALVHLVV